MKRWGWIVVMIAMSAGGARAEMQVATYRPQYLPPAELARVLGLREREGHNVLEWRAGDVVRSVEVLRNDSANLIMLTGEAGDVAMAEVLIKAADVAPRQIMIEATIVEVDRDRLTEMGFDWSQISVRAGTSYRYDSRYRKSTYTSDGFSGENRFKTTDRASNTTLTGDLFTDLRILERAGAATYRDAPRLLTLNNRRATILDGERVTYITRYSSYTNLFETDTLDAGLTLSIVPSLGESGYLTMDVRAELTNLTREISGSPVKDGQIVENTVVVKDGETVLLGGFQRTAERRNRRGLPVLGRLIPFLFSRETVTKTRRENFVAITARVVDLATGVDEATRGILKNPEPPKKY
jgi:type IV pilus assembly protein PilQ